MLRHVDLCSGIGGFALGFEWAGVSRPVLFCDIDPWCRDVLRKHWPDVPIKEDVKELANDANQIPDCDILTAGYPCQPFSLAGNRKGEEDDRHIWPDIRRVVALKRPTWVVLENVYGHISLGLDQVLADLEAESYASRTFVLPAAGVNAPHRRDRLWIVAHAIGTGGQTRSADRVGDDHGSEVGKEQPADQSSQGGSADVANTDSGSFSERGQRCNRQTSPGKPGKRSEDHVNANDVANAEVEGLEGQRRRGELEGVEHHRRDAPTSRWPTRQDTWRTEPDVGRVANGIPGRVDRLKGLGNAIVPQVAEQIGIAIRQWEQKSD